MFQCGSICSVECTKYCNGPWISSYILQWHFLLSCPIRTLLLLFTPQEIGWYSGPKIKQLKCIFILSYICITVQLNNNLRGLLPVQVGLYEELAGPVGGQAGTERLQHQVLSLQCTEFGRQRMITNGCTESRQKPVPFQESNMRI
jgi:hypothetical protein